MTASPVRIAAVVLPARGGEHLARALAALDWADERAVLAVDGIPLDLPAGVASVDDPERVAPGVRRLGAGPGPRRSGSSRCGRRGAPRGACGRRRPTRCSRSPASRPRSACASPPPDARWSDLAPRRPPPVVRPWARRRASRAARRLVRARSDVAISPPARRDPHRGGRDHARRAGDDAGLAGRPPRPARRRASSLAPARRRRARRTTAQGTGPARARPLGARRARELPRRRHLREVSGSGGASRWSEAFWTKTVPAGYTALGDRVAARARPGRPRPGARRLAHRARPSHRPRGVRPLDAERARAFRFVRPAAATPSSASSRRGGVCRGAWCIWHGVGLRPRPRRELAVTPHALAGAAPVARL